MKFRHQYFTAVSEFFYLYAHLLFQVFFTLFLEKSKKGILSMIYRLMKIASKIASDFMNEKEAFDMTERQW